MLIKPALAVKPTPKPTTIAGPAHSFLPASVDNLMALVSPTLSFSPRVRTARYANRTVGEKMDFENIGEIIASRKLQLLDENDTKRIVSVFVGKPQQAPNSHEYYCPFQVIGVGSQKT